MDTPLRILRAQAENLRRTPIPLTAREAAVRADILERGAGLLALNGRQHLSKPRFAKALKLSPLTVERHFADLDDLLGEIIHIHLHRLAMVLRQVAADAPNRIHRLCGAYLAATRTPYGQLTDAHVLLTRDRRFLPEDMLGPIEYIREYLGETIKPAAGLQILDFLDAPEMSCSRIAAMLEFVEITMHAIDAAWIPAPLVKPQAVAGTWSTPDMPGRIAQYEETDDLTRLRPAGMPPLGPPEDIFRNFGIRPPHETLPTPQDAPPK